VAQGHARYVPDRTSRRGWSRSLADRALTSPYMAIELRWRARPSTCGALNGKSRTPTNRVLCTFPPERAGAWSIIASQEPNARSGVCASGEASRGAGGPGKCCGCTALHRRGASSYRGSLPSNACSDESATPDSPAKNAGRLAARAFLTGYSAHAETPWAVDPGSWRAGLFDSGHADGAPSAAINLLVLSEYPRDVQGGK